MLKTCSNYECAVYRKILLALSKSCLWHALHTVFSYGHTAIDTLLYFADYEYAVYSRLSTHQKPENGSTF